MIPYVIVFIVAVSLTYVGQRVFAKRKYLGIALFAASVLILSLFAALRDYSVGTDLLAHKVRYFDAALSYDSFGKYMSLFSGEYLFSALAYLVAHIFGSMHVFMFVLTFSLMSVVHYYGAKYYPKYVALVLAAFLLMFFNTSLNVMRQAMAISFVIPAFFLLRQNKKIRSLILILVAALFHTSALFTLIMFPIHYFAKKQHQFRYYVLTVILFLGLCLSLAALPGDDMSSTLIGNYANYLEIERTNLNVQFFILKTALFGFITYFYRFYKNDETCKNYYYLAILDLLFYFFSNFVMFGYRLSYYFVVFYPFFIPAVAEKLKGKHKVFFCGVTVILLLLYWVDRNIAIGYDGTIPYIMNGGF